MNEFIKMNFLALTFFIDLLLTCCNLRENYCKITTTTNKHYQQQEEVQLQWNPAFTSQRVQYQSNQKLLQHYQHSKNQLISLMHS